MKTLKKIFGLMCLLAVVITGVTLTSCSSNDDEKDEESGDVTLTVNGQSMSFKTNGSYDDTQRRVHITFYRMPDAKDQYQFGWYSDGDPKVGDDIMGKSKLFLMSDIDLHDYDIKSGSVSIESVDPAGGKVTLKFDNLTGEYEGKTLTFNGTAATTYHFQE